MDSVLDPDIWPTPFVVLVWSVLVGAPLAALVFAMAGWLSSQYNQTGERIWVAMLKWAGAGGGAVIACVIIYVAAYFLVGLATNLTKGML